jgi:hypothetical protein
MTKKKTVVKAIPEDNSLASWGEVIRKQGEENRAQVQLQRKYVTKIEEEIPLTEDAETLLSLAGQINSISSMMLHPHSGYTKEELDKWLILTCHERKQWNEIAALAKENNLI